MKEYVVLEIKCKKELTLDNAYSFIKDRFYIGRNLFAFQNIEFDRISIECKKLYKELDLGRYSYVKELDHLKASPYYDPKRDDRYLVSNLDDCWEWHNENTQESLSPQELDTLVCFASKLKKMDVSTVMICFDEINWDGIKVNKGTYGYKKADGIYGLGEGYLSNCVSIGRFSLDECFTAYVSCEKRFEDSPHLMELVNYLGVVNHKTYCFAPESNLERVEWQQVEANAKRKFEKTIAETEQLSLERIEKLPDRHTTKNERINTKKYIRTYLSVDGWQIIPSCSDEIPVVIAKSKGDNEIHFSIVSRSNGHHMQVLVYYRNKKFLFSNQIHVLFFNYISEEQMDSYFRNIKTVVDFVYSNL